MNVTKRSGQLEPLNISKIQRAAQWACEGLDVSQSELEVQAKLMFFEGIKTSDIQDALIRSAAALITLEKPDYTFTAARLLLLKLYKEIFGSINYAPIEDYLCLAVNEKRIDPQLLSKFDLEKINAAIKPERDFLFNYIGLQTIADRYLVRERATSGKEGAIIEAPQHFWMRVAMGLAILEDNPTDAAIEFYDVLSQHEFVNSTPTLFNSGTLRAQMSSCYLNQVSDQIDADGLDSDNWGTERFNSIFGLMQECANLSKFAGGIGTDWTPVRSAGDVIKGTNGQSSGVVPYLKIYNDTAVAVNQGGKRNGSFSAYLEPWHPDFLDFIELKKNSGDDRRRAHDIFPAAWTPDLFMKRVKEKGVWSFFSPAEFPELHELYGDAFEARYTELEAQGEYRSQMPAFEVWRKWLTMLFETGHPWVTFKDESNRRSPQDHVGVVHSSNLCTEITLNTSKDETAVCNLGSLNLAVIKPENLRRVIRTAMRMLDNVIDINFYPSERAKRSNLRHRPIGLGVMGYTELLVKMGIDWESEEHIEFADELFEVISYYAIEASSDLAAIRGRYESFEGSKWSRGILPIDTARDKTQRLDWDVLRQKVMRQGMRNSNTMAIAPTATISNIVGTTPCIEPIFKRYYTKKNLSGMFLVADPCMRYGRPELCKEAFEVDQKWVILSAAKRQKWIDQSQSINIFIKQGIKGSQLSDIYMLAWEEGLKTTYYLRNQTTESEVTKVGEKKAEVAQPAGDVLEEEVKMCSLDNPSCEACQ